MEIIKEFFTELDRSWRLVAAGKVQLRVIGSAALMLGTGYSRGTKDSDILETADIAGEVRRELLALAGRDSVLAVKYRLYLDIVNHAIPFLPQRPSFKPAGLPRLKNFDVVALDVTDVVVSKLKRFSANDAADIRAMAERGLLQPATLAARFQAAVDVFSMDARAEDLPKYVSNLHSIERDFLGVPASDIRLPGWL